MKKILFATTALIATSGMAAAEVSFSGYGRFGLLYIEDNNVNGAGAPTGNEETRLESRFRLNIDGSTETDGGVAFSARVRMQADDNANGTAGTAGLNGARFTTQYEGFRVDVGNIAGVIDNLPNYYGYEPGLTFFTGQYVGVNYSFDGYSSTGAGQNGIFAQYAFGDFAISGSYSDDNTADEEYGVSFAWANDQWSVALGYSESSGATAGTDSDMIVLTAGATFGAFSGVIFVGDESSDTDPTGLLFDTFYGLSVNYEVGAATDIVFSYGSGSATNDTTGYGIGVKHDLGGGVQVRGGVGVTDAFDASIGALRDQTIADLGVQFNF